MKNKEFTWRSYLALTIIIFFTYSLYTLPLFGLTNPSFLNLQIRATFVLAVISLITIFLPLFKKQEKKWLSVLIILIFLINSSVIAFFLWFGTNLV